MSNSDRALYASLNVHLGLQTPAQYQAYGQSNSHTANHSPDPSLSFYPSTMASAFGKAEISTLSPSISIPFPGRKPTPPLPASSLYPYKPESAPVQGLAMPTPNCISNSPPTYHTAVANSSTPSSVGSAQFVANVDFKVDAVGSVMLPTPPPTAPFLTSSAAWRPPLSPPPQQHGQISQPHHGLVEESNPVHSTSYNPPQSPPSFISRPPQTSMHPQMPQANNLYKPPTQNSPSSLPTHSLSPASSYLPPSAPIYNTSVPSSMPASAVSFQPSPSSPGLPALSASLSVSAQQAVGMPSIYPTQQQALSPHVQAPFHPTQGQAHPYPSQGYAPQQQQPQLGGKDLAKAGLRFAGRMGLRLAKKAIKSALAPNNNGNVAQSHGNNGGWNSGQPQTLNATPYTQSTTSTTVLCTTEESLSNYGQYYDVQTQNISVIDTYQTSEFDIVGDTQAMSITDSYIECDLGANVEAITATDTLVNDGYDSVTETQVFSTVTDTSTGADTLAATDAISGTDTWSNGQDILTQLRFQQQQQQQENIMALNEMIRRNNEQLWNDYCQTIANSGAAIAALVD